MSPCVSIYVCKQQRQPVISSGSAGYKSYKRLVLEDDELIDMPQHQLLERLAPLKNNKDSSKGNIYTVGGGTTFL